MKRKAHEKAEERMAKKQHQDNLKELNFFFKVRKKLNNDKLYNEFLKCLNLFSNKIITRVELVPLLHGHRLLAPCCCCCCCCRCVLT
jgi:histone deacetylase complex regulatory component SIN3